MKEFRTGKAIRLRNIEDSYYDLNIGDVFYNFVKDIATPNMKFLIRNIYIPFS